MSPDSIRDSTQSAGIGESDDVVREFLSETRENLDQFDRDVIELGSNPAASDTLPRIFRTLHTIKGASGFLNFSKLEAITHAGEGLLSRIREGTLLLNAEITATLLELADAIRSALSNIEATAEEGAVDCQYLTDQINRVQTSQDTRCEAAVKPAAPEAAACGGVGTSAEYDGGKPIGQLLVERAGVDPAAVAAARELQRRGDLRTMGEILVSQGVVSPSLARSVLEYQQEARAATVSDTHVRVKLARLDKLISLVGELALVRDEVLQLSRRPGQDVLRTIAPRLDALTTELEHESKLARTQPIAVLWGRLPRLAWDLALAGGKHVRLKLEGQDVELDRLVLEAIKDPLMHLVRNSVDHGIETPPRRLAAGKPAEGLLTVRAYRQCDDVCIDVSDDGAGIDIDRVKSVALTTGWLSTDQAARMSPEEIANLVFLNGITTAEKVTSISGRGVGMDVVKANVESLGGTVEVRTETGKGTTVTMRIPLRPASC